MNTNPRPAARSRFQPPVSLDDLTSTQSLRVSDVGQLRTVSALLANLARAVEQTRPRVRAADDALRCGPYGAHVLGHPDATAQTGHIDAISRRARDVSVQVDASLVDLQRCLKDTADAVERVAKSVTDGDRDNTERLKRLFDAEFKAPRPGGPRGV